MCDAMRRSVPGRVCGGVGACGAMRAMRWRQGSGKVLVSSQGALARARAGVGCSVCARPDIDIIAIEPQAALALACSSIGGRYPGPASQRGGPEDVCSGL